MNCPACHSAWSTVYKTRRVTKYRTKRYKYCNHCFKRFSTTENIDPPRVLKKAPVEPETPEEEDIYIIEEDDT